MLGELGECHSRRVGWNHFTTQNNVVKRMVFLELICLRKFGTCFTLMKGKGCKTIEKQGHIN